MEMLNSEEIIDKINDGDEKIECIHKRCFEFVFKKEPISHKFLRNENININVMYKRNLLLRGINLPKKLHYVESIKLLSEKNIKLQFILNNIIVDFDNSENSFLNYIFEKNLGINLMRFEEAKLLFNIYNDNEIYDLMIVRIIENHNTNWSS